MCAWNILDAFGCICDALYSLWNTLSNRNANSNEDDNCTPGSFMSRHGGDRQGCRFQSSNEEEKLPKSTLETYGIPRSQCSFGEENIHPQLASIVSAQQSTSETTYDSLELPSDKESAQPRRPSTRRTLEISQQRALICGSGSAAAASSSRDSAQIQTLYAAAASKLTPLPSSAATTNGRSANVQTSSSVVVSKLTPLHAAAVPSRRSTNEKKRRLMQKAVNEHIRSHCVQNLSSRRQDSLEVDEFLRRQLSSNRNARLPYRPDVVNIWFRMFVTRMPTAEPEGMPLGVDVNVINLMKTNDLRRIRTAVATFRLISFKDGEELHFHATDAQSAKYILEKGIDLTKCKGRHDFSNGYGFYVSTDYTRATEWALRKSRKLWHRTGAIIAFKVSIELRNEEPYLRLGVSTDERRREWQKIVSHFRNGLLSGKVLNVKFIRGPVGRNAFLRPGEMPVPFDFTQICICDEEYAKRYGSLSNICFVIFFKVN